MKNLGAIFIVLMAGTIAVAADSTRFEVYNLALADPVSSEQLAKSIVGEEGVVVLDQAHRRLLVSTTDKKHAQLRDAFGKITVAPKNIRIDVQFVGGGESRDVEVGIKPEGAVVIGPEGVRSRINLNPRLRHETTRSQHNVQQTIMVGNGRKGTLRVGEDVPYVQWLVDYGIRHGLYRQQVVWQEVGSRLLVEPTILGEGDMISIRITPELSGIVDGNPLHTTFASASTEIVVKDGETFRIGGHDQHKDFYSRFLVGMDRSRNTETLDILLTPRIMDP